MKNIIIYCNCQGIVISEMFKKHYFTKDKYNISYISNYLNLHNTEITEDHKILLNNCNILIFQPFNNHYENTEYDIQNLIKYINKDFNLIKISYFRFRGFWYDSDYKPFDEYMGYKFLNLNYYGIHNSFINL